MVGKFYPPHRGHRHLIDTAVSQSDRVTVLVVDGRDEDPPATLRMEWLRELHPDAEVILIPDIERDEDSVAWARAAREAVGHETIDAVFDSEDYGVPWAKAISELQGSECRNVFVGRGLVEISGTQVRSDPARFWDYLDAPVRAHYVKRVCVVGAESTGSTTLARSLAAAYATHWVPEYGRDYTVEKFTIGTGDRWLPSDFLRIALEQNALEDRWRRRRPSGSCSATPTHSPPRCGRRSTWAQPLTRCGGRWTRTGAPTRSTSSPTTWGSRGKTMASGSAIRPGRG